MSWFKRKNQFRHMKVGKGTYTIKTNSNTYSGVVEGKIWFIYNDEIHVLTAHDVFQRKFNDITEKLLSVSRTEFIPVSSIIEITFVETEPDFSIQVEL